MIYLVIGVWLVFLAILVGVWFYHHLTVKARIAVSLGVILLGVALYPLCTIYSSRSHVSSYASLTKENLSDYDLELYKKKRESYIESTQKYIKEAKSAIAQLASDDNAVVGGETVKAGRPVDLTAPATTTGWGSPVFKYDGKENVSITATVPIYDRVNGEISLRKGEILVTSGVNGKVQVSKDTLSPLLMKD